MTLWEYHRPSNTDIFQARLMARDWKTVLRNASDRIRLRWHEHRRQIVQGIIIMMHEVNAGPSDYARELATGVTLEFLESIVKLLRRDGWDIVPLEEGLARLGRGNLSRRFAILTFDDGYRDTLNLALPLLQRHDAPFIVYVPTGGPTRELHCWWLGLRALFQLHDRVDISAMGGRFDCSDYVHKIEGLRQALAWVHADYRRVTELDETFLSYGISLPALNESYFMDENELCRLTRYASVSIGAHSASHNALSLLEPTAAREELLRNRHYLEKLLDRPILDLAYPYGNPHACGEREFALASDCKFRSAVTTRYGPLFAGHRYYALALPRISAGGSADFAEFASTVVALRNAASHEFAMEWKR
jgi:peptidoglycan/xylan/chitin deacetylase (PgdA/CDA1 family)